VSLFVSENDEDRLQIVANGPAG